MVIVMLLGSISDQKTLNYLSGIQALQLGRGSDQLDVLDQLVSRASPGRELFQGYVNWEEDEGTLLKTYSPL